MTRKHFQALAETLKGSRPWNIDSAARFQWEADVKAVASALRQFNPRFNNARFLEACGVNEAVDYPSQAQTYKVLHPTAGYVNVTVPEE